MNGARPVHGVPADKERIAAHTGTMALIAAGVDQRMSDVGALLTSFEHPDAERGTWNGQRATDKIKRLRRIFGGWTQGRQLIDGASKCFKYRNTLSHGSVYLRFEDEGQSVFWERVSEGKDGHSLVLPIDILELDTWEMRFWAVDYCFKYIIYPGTLFMRDYNTGPEILNLKHALEEDEASSSQVPGDGSDWDHAKDWLFPVLR